MVTCLLSNAWRQGAGGHKGPVTADAIRDLLRRGLVSYDTLVWNETFKQSWKPIRDTELPLIEGVAPPPLPAKSVNNTWAWLLALVPIIGTFTERVFSDFGTQLSNEALFIAYSFVNSAFALLDAHQITRSGRNTKNIRLGIWFWLIPIYLLQRARALQQSFVYFLLWIGSVLTALYISNPDIFSGSTYWGIGIPRCDSAFSKNLLKTAFGNIPLMQAAGTHALDVRQVSEISTTDMMRTCRAIVLASNTMDYTIRYTIESQDQKFFIKANIVP
jgi:hypothetical protein